MITIAEIARGLTGSWRLARRDPAGLGFFDVSPEGFWRSFWAPALVAPFGLILDWGAGAFDGERGVAVALVVQVIAAVIGAVAFPLAMAGIAQRIGRPQHYIRFIVANNWSSLLRMAAFFPVALLAVTNPQYQPVAGGVTIVLLIYEAYITHVALEIRATAAAAIVLLDILIDTLVATVSKGILG